LEYVPEIRSGLLPRQKDPQGYRLVIASALLGDTLGQKNSTCVHKGPIRQMSTCGAEGICNRVQRSNCVRREVIPDEMSMDDMRTMLCFVSYSTPQASSPFARFKGLCSTLSNMMALVGPTTDSCMAEMPVVLKINE
jgi:hypothetical protein